MHFKDIIEEFETITNTKRQPNTLIVFGTIEGANTSRRYEYKHNAVRNEVQKRVNYFKGL
jgi:hypothetical protein